MLTHGLDQGRSRAVAAHNLRAGVRLDWSMVGGVAVNKEGLGPKMYWYIE